jgi:hypothetical protein
MFDFSDPELFWLNVTNALLGVVTLVCVLAVGYAVAKELFARAVAWRRATADYTDSHSLVLTDLGITMADGGKPIEQGTVAVSERGITRPAVADDNSVDERFIHRSEN